MEWRAAFEMGEKGPLAKVSLHHRDDSKSDAPIFLEMVTIIVTDSGHGFVGGRHADFKSVSRLLCSMRLVDVGSLTLLRCPTGTSNEMSME